MHTAIANVIMIMYMPWHLTATNPINDPKSVPANIANAIFSPNGSETPKDESL
jgi:hypothetical protein